MDTRLSHSRPRLELGRGVIAEGRMTTPPIVEHLDVFEDVLCRFVPGRVVPMIHELTRGGCTGFHPAAVCSASCLASLQPYSRSSASGHSACGLAK